jgi:acyl carrier protein
MAESVEALFARALNIDIGDVNDGLAYNSRKEWDSVAHMGLIAVLEEAYGIMIETDDIIDMSSVGKAKEILRKYGVDAGSA